MVETKSILEMAQGAIMEQVNVEVGKIVNNILDLNTEAKKKLLPNNAVQTTIYVGADSSTGEIQAVEMVPQVPGQQSFDGTIQEEPKILKIAGGM